MWTLEDGHIWNLAERITSKHDFQDLGLNILKTPGYTVDSALYDEKEIQNSAHKVLKVWYQGQNNRQEAYRNLYTALYSNGWRFLAGKLKQWVEEATKQSPLSESKKLSRDSGSAVFFFMCCFVRPCKFWST